MTGLSEEELDVGDLPGNGTGADEPDEMPAGVKVSVTTGKGKKKALKVENAEALDALAAFGDVGSTFYIERVGPQMHRGRKVQMGRIRRALALEELRDGQRLHDILGPLGNEFIVGLGKRRVPVKIAGGDLSALDYEPDEPAPTVMGFDAAGRPVAMQAPQPQAFQYPHGFPPPQSAWGGVAMPFGSPFGQVPPASPEAIAIAVAKALGDGKKDEKALDREWDVQQKRWEREDREKKEQREKEEKREKEERERRDREEARKTTEEKERREREERREKEARDRADKEEREQARRWEEERKEKAREAEDRAKRWEQEQKERADERRLQHEREMKRIEEDAKARVEAAKAAKEGEASIFQRLKELKELEGDRDDPFDMFVKFKQLTTEPRSIVGEVLAGLPGAFQAAGQEIARVRSTPFAPLPPGYQLPPPAAPAANPAAPGAVAGQAPQAMATTLSAQEFLDGLETVREAIEKKVEPARVIAILNRPRPAPPAVVDPAAHGCPNLIAIVAQRSPQQMMAEAETLHTRPELSPEQRAILERFKAVATTPDGIQWIFAFFNAVKGG